jgi:hypothetical protein
MEARHIIDFMINTEAPATRTLTIVLPESDWRALRTAEPDAIGWLQAQIRQRLAADGTATPAPRLSSSTSGTAESWWGDDEY